MQKKSYHQEVYRLHDPFPLAIQNAIHLIQRNKERTIGHHSSFFFSLTSLIEASTIEENPTTFVINSSN